MTSIKNLYADEIARAMAKSLGDEEFTKMFKSASVTKVAGAALEAFKKAVDIAVQAGKDLEGVYTSHQGALTTEENAEPGTIEKARAYMAEKARTPMHRQPGMAFPQAADGCVGQDCVESQMQMAAAEFALTHLSKIADALDGKGFDKFASIIDEAMKKISSK